VTAYEVNFDGLIGPTHHYGGLSQGNLASLEHRHAVSSPRKAALQGLEKMKRLADMGFIQAFLPPQWRPDFEYLESQGFSGTPHQMIAQVAQERPDLLSIAYSASAMWTANAATVSPSSDCADGRVHFTPANLQTMPHRAIEAKHTTETLRAIFHDEKYFVVHDPLPAAIETSDEGAANHTRLCRAYDNPGVELFVYGRDENEANDSRRFPARQTRAACEAIAEAHRLSSDRCVFARQHPRAIEAGVFHNDVISVGNQSVHLVHQFAFADQEKVLSELADKFGPGLQQIVIREEQLSLAEAVRSYLFNSQLLSVGSEGMILLCPNECVRNEEALRTLGDIVEDDNNPIIRCDFIDLRESMQNGGGPACLRLRVVLTEEELAAVPESYFITEKRYRQLRKWIQCNYPRELSLDDLRDENFIEEQALALFNLELLLES